MTDKAKWASDVTNAIAGIAEVYTNWESYRIHNAMHPNSGDEKYLEQFPELLEQRKAVLEALLKDGV